MTIGSLLLQFGEFGGGNEDFAHSCVAPVLDVSTVPGNSLLGRLLAAARAPRRRSQRQLAMSQCAMSASIFLSCLIAGVTMATK